MSDEYSTEQPENHQDSGGQSDDGRTLPGYRHDEEGAGDSGISSQETIGGISPQHQSSADESSYAFLSPPVEAGDLGSLEQYRVLELLGEGGMGLVFRALDPKLERTVALKVMRPQAAMVSNANRRFLREARAMAAITSDHVVTIYEVGEHNSIPFLAMEYLRGETVERRLRRSAVITLQEILRIGRETCMGLAAAHDSGLIHRDIKPGNLWLEATADRVKILDFGLACAARGDGQITQAGTVLGTPEYMSPEQVDGTDTDARSDLFSLGCVLYRMTTGAPPFKGRTTLAILQELAAGRAQPLHEMNPHVPLELSELVTQLLAKDRNERPRSAHEVGQRLGRLEQGFTQLDPITVRPMTGVYPAPTGSTNLPSGVTPVTATGPFTVQQAAGPARWWLLPVLLLLIVLAAYGGIALFTTLEDKSDDDAETSVRADAYSYPPPHPEDDRYGGTNISSDAWDHRPPPPPWATNAEGRPEWDGERPPPPHHFRDGRRPPPHHRRPPPPDEEE
jgi:serine/threonine protein kinase